MATPKPLEASELDQFTGSENYYRNFLGLIYTEGVKYLADRAGAYWLIDAIASHVKTNSELRKGNLRNMQFWKLVVNPDHSAVLTCREDSDIEPVVTQKMEWTDFPLKEQEIWVGHDERGYVAYLPSEH